MVQRGYHFQNNTFITNIRAILQVFISLQPRMVLLSYPDDPFTNKSGWFLNIASVISSISRAWWYIDQCGVKEGIPTKIKLFVHQDLLPSYFNSSKFATTCDDLDSFMFVCSIQACNFIVHVCSLGSRKTMNDHHCNMLMNNKPQFHKIKIQVFLKKINNASDYPF